MKRMIAAGALSLALAFQTAAPAKAVAQPKTWDERFDSGSAEDEVARCEAFVALFSHIWNMGECVAFSRSNIEAVYAQFCNQLNDLGRLEEINGATTVGQCVTFLKKR